MAVGDAPLRPHGTDSGIRGNRARKGRIGSGLAVLVQERIGKESPAGTSQLEVSHPMPGAQSREPA